MKLLLLVLLNAIKGWLRHTSQRAHPSLYTCTDPIRADQFVSWSRSRVSSQLCSGPGSWRQHWAERLVDWRSSTATRWWALCMSPILNLSYGAVELESGVTLSRVQPVTIIEEITGQMGETFTASSFHEPASSNLWDAKLLESVHLEESLSPKQVE